MIDYDRRPGHPSWPHCVEIDDHDTGGSAGTRPPSRRVEPHGPLFGIGLERHAGHAARPPVNSLAMSSSFSGLRRRGSAMGSACLSGR